MERREQLIVVRGAGDLATGVIHRLHCCGYPVLALEIARPAAIRRKVAFSEAVYNGECTVENVRCRRAANAGEAMEIIRSGDVALLIDPNAECLNDVKPWALVDAILAKKNLGTTKEMAPRTIALGPGFTAGEDVQLVIETKRGHNLGRIIRQGSAAPNTGIPGVIAGYGKERVIHAPAQGIFEGAAAISDTVERGQLIGQIDTGKGKVPVCASISGILRGILPDGYPVSKGFKLADIDPRPEERENCFTISDKARCIAGSVLAGLLELELEDKP